MGRRGEASRGGCFEAQRERRTGDRNGFAAQRIAAGGEGPAERRQKALLAAGAASWGVSRALVSTSAAYPPALSAASAARSRAYFTPGAFSASSAARATRGSAYSAALCSAGSRFCRAEARVVLIASVAAGACSIASSWALAAPAMAACGEEGVVWGGKGLLVGGTAARPAGLEEGGWRRGEGGSGADVLRASAASAAVSFICGRAARERSAQPEAPRWSFDQALRVC